MSDDRTVAQLRRELELYRLVLEAERTADTEHMLRRVLASAVEAVGAARGYLALLGGEGVDAKEPVWSCAHACSVMQVAALHNFVSSSIIDSALSVRRITRVTSALGHPEFFDASSVRGNKITSVICAPLGSSQRAVLYVQDRRGGGVFTASHEAWISEFTELLAPLIDRLSIASLGPTPAADATAPWRVGGAFSSVVGTSVALAAVFAELWALRDDPGVLCISGRRGVGKVTLARAVHAASVGRDRPTVALDPPRTGPRGARVLSGLLRDAGLVLTRRIEEHPPEDQHVLLAWAKRGSGRVIVTCVDPESLAEDVREALGSNWVRVPAWGERVGDAALLVNHLGSLVAERSGVRWPGIDGAAEEHLVQVLASDGPSGVSRMLAGALVPAPSRPLTVDALRAEGESDRYALWRLFDQPPAAWRDAKERFQSAYLMHVLGQHHGDVDAAAATLNVSRSGYYELLRQRGLRRGEG